MILLVRPFRARVPLLLLLLLAACGGSPSFDERKESGLEAFRRGEYEEAVALLDPCARERARDFDVRYYLARSYEMQNDYAAALREWDDVLLLRPRLVEGHYRRGNCLAVLEKPDEAIAAWGEATRIDPSFQKAYYNQARAYEDMERWDDAARHYFLAVQADSTFVPALINLGFLFQRAEKWDAAIDMFGRAIRVDPVFTPPYMNRIRVLILAGREEEAATRVRELLETPGVDSLLADSLEALLGRLSP